jgi:hypothetical protein
VTNPCQIKKIGKPSHFATMCRPEPSSNAAADAVVQRQLQTTLVRYLVCSNGASGKHQPIDDATFIKPNTLDANVVEV